MKTCPDCGNMFATRVQLRQHILTNHPLSHTALQVGTGSKIMGRMTADSAQSFLQPSLNRMGIPDGALGDTPEGSAWALKALHPCTDVPLAAEGIPDQTDVAAAEPGWKANYTIQSPGESPIGTWDCCIIVTPLDSQMAVVCTGDSTGGSVNFKDPSTWNFNTPILFPPRAGEPDTAWANTQSSAGRRTYKGITVYQIAPSLADQGRIYGWQGAREPSFEELSRNIGTGGNVATYTVSCPLSEDELVVLDETYEGPSKEGIYMPMRFRQPIHSWQPTDFGPDGQGGRIQLDIKNNGSVITKVPNSDGNVTQWPAYIDNTLTGVIIFRGLSNQASLMIKARAGEELAPLSNSLLVPFSTPSPLQDEVALRRVVDIQHHLPLAYPASYNFLGEILRTIGNVVRGVTGFTRYIPGPIGMISGGIHDLMPTQQPMRPVPAPRRRTAPVPAPRKGRATRGTVR